MTDAAFPVWLVGLAWTGIAAGVVCAVVVLVDVVRHPQTMTVMNTVWPVTMLFGGAAWLWFYWTRGRASTADRDRSMAESVAVGTSHCGAGCALGDLVGEFALVAAPGLAAVFGLGWLFDQRIFAAWALDFVLAYAFGIVFQYFAIAPMQDIPARAALWRAVKADTLSISAWQIGMYGLMALAQFALFPAVFGGRAGPLSPVFWFSMQLAMLAGFATAYPVNWMLVSRGVKEKM